MASSTQQDAAVCVWRTASKLEAPTAAAGGASPADRPERDYSATEQHRSFGPPLTGAWLKLAVAAFESPLGGTMFSLAARQPGMAQLLELLRVERVEEVPRPSSLHEVTWGGPLFTEAQCSSQDAGARLQAAVQSVQRGGRSAGCTKCSTATAARPTVLDYATSYTQGLVTPSVAAERVIKFLETHNEKQHWLSAWSAADIRAAAAASTQRYAEGRPLSVLDGVPFVVKDCIDALPHPTACGTTFMGELHRPSADAPCVAACKQLGAVLLGKGAMNEFGVFPHGHNAHAGTTQNPHAPNRTAGGSSSGAAAAVAAGLCPVAIGADGGGSIRIPSSLCGVVGLKPTTGRLADDHGAAHGAYTSLTVSGPIANSVPDLLLMYAVMANVDYADADTRKPGSAALCLPGVEAAAAAAANMRPRALQLPEALVQVADEAAISTEQRVLLDSQPLRGVRVGVYDKWFRDCKPLVGDVVRKTLERLLQLGATRVDVSLPDLDLVQAGHIATWAKEQEADGDAAGWLKDWSLRTQLNYDTRMFMAVASNITQQDYLQAQRMRARAVKRFEQAFKQCDVIITPATPTAATELPAGHDTTGVYDPSSTLEMVRFTQAANVTGLPALVLPGGRQLAGLPVGVQLMGRPFDEAGLLVVAAALEQHLLEDAQPRPLPNLVLNPIECAPGTHPKARALAEKMWASKKGDRPGGMFG